MESLPVLLVEDQPDDQFLTLRTLKKLRIRNVAVVNEGEEALRYLYRGLDRISGTACPLPELVILDLRMPKFDGFEFLKSMRADNRTREIPVIVLSSSSQDSDRTRCREFGVSAYLKKPLDITAFERVLRTITNF